MGCLMRMRMNRVDGRMCITRVHLVVGLHDPHSCPTVIACLARSFVSAQVIGTKANIMRIRSQELEYSIT
jgi:membrane glycosyltransferase